MMSHRPRVSILIPTYNYARFLPEAIDSVLAQDFEDLEILISDDHSRDDSANVIRHYAAQDPRIRYEIQDGNLGMVENWNWCLREAKGTYIKYLFGDDCLGNAQAIGTLVKMLEDHPRASLALSARDVIDENSRIIDRWDHIGPAGVHSGNEIARRCLIGMRNLIGEPTVVMFRASQAGQGFNEEYRQIVDLEMWIRLLKEGDLVYSKRPLARFRRHSKQQTEVNSRQQLGEKEQLRLCKEHLDVILPDGSSLTPEERGYFLNIVRVLCRKPSEDPSMHFLDQRLRLFLPLVQAGNYTWRERELLFQIVYFIKREEHKSGKPHELSYFSEAFLPIFGEIDYSARLLNYRCMRALRDMAHLWHKCTASMP